MKVEDDREKESSSLVLPPRFLRVLLVESDDSTRQIIAALLRKCSYRGRNSLSLFTFYLFLTIFSVVIFGFVQVVLWVAICLLHLHIMVF